jgi:anti-sigma regulatory factor (Ser/Thr protein kinase)
MRSSPTFAGFTTCRRGNTNTCVVILRERLSRSYPAVPDSVTHARRTVAAFAAAAGLTGERLDSVRLAVSEATSNVVLHAYRDWPGAIQVTSSTASGELGVWYQMTAAAIRPQPRTRASGSGSY